MLLFAFQGFKETRQQGKERMNQSAGKFSRAIMTLFTWKKEENLSYTPTFRINKNSTGLVNVVQNQLTSILN